MPTSLSTPQTLPLGYTQAATLGPIQNLEKIVWQNTGGVVVFQVARLDPSNKPIFDQTEAVLPPGIWGMDKIKGIRFRSRDVAALATLDPCTGYFEDDPDPFNPGTIPGAVAAITGAVNVQHNTGLIGSQPTIDFEDSAGGTFAWTITNDAPGNRVKVQAPDVVTSVFGRNGVVTAQTGDYLASQVTNAADKASAAQQTFTGNIQTPALGVNTAPGAAGTITASGRLFSGAASTGGIWVDGGSQQFFGSTDATHIGIYNTGWWMTIDQSGNTRFQGSFGYQTGVGNGGTVTQLTSLSTAVTLNTICGQINMFSTAWAGGLVVNFTVNNSLVTSVDTIIINSSNNPMTTSLIPFIQGVFPGAFVVGVYNAGGLTGAGSLRLNFSVIKAANN